MQPGFETWHEVTKTNVTYHSLKWQKHSLLEDVATFGWWGLVTIYEENYSEDYCDLLYI